MVILSKAGSSEYPVDLDVVGWDSRLERRSKDMTAGACGG